MKKFWQFNYSLALISVLALSSILSLPLGVSASNDSGITSLVSVGSYDGYNIYAGSDPSVSSDGRYVAFLGTGKATDGSGRTISQIFVRDTADGTTKLVSANNNNEPIGGDHPSISNDGRYVAFVSSATNVVGDDTNGMNDVFVRDVTNATTTRASVASDGTQANNNSDVPEISGNGQYIIFRSSASNLVSGDTNNAQDVFRHDMQSGTTTRISVNNNGDQAICTGAYLHYNCHSPASLPGPMSSNGRYILFQSRADNLTQVHPILLSNGTYDNANQVYIRDTVNNTTTLVTQTYDGVQSRYGGTAESLTDDGRYIVFACSSSAYGCGFVTEGDNGLGQVYVRDMATGINTKVSINNSGVQSNALAGSGLISNDGETILFSSTADNLDTSDTSGTPNIYARNLSAQTTSRVNLSNSGADANGQITSIVTSPDDRFVAFTSQATNLVENNNSGSINVFLHDRFPAPPTPANLATLSPAQNPSLSWDAVSGADSYNIYRNGTKIGSTASTTYTDTTAPEGSDNYYVTAGNSVGESDPSNTVNILVDRTAPIPGTPVWTANPVALGNNTSFNIPATDDMSVTVDVSGVSGGEYFVGTDPGVGNATSLNWDGTNFTSNPFGADLAPGVYNVGIRAHDAAGNWSPAQVAYLVVYAPSGPGYIVGQQNLTPGSGDTLPWISTSPKDFATFGFNVKFTSIGTVDPASKFNFNYVEKGNCNSPNTPDCRSFILTANDFNWFAIGGTNSSQGSFQGTATLNINGTESNVIFRVEAIDGTQLDPSRSDNFVLKIYPEGSNAETAIPIYQVSADFTSSSGNAKGGIQIK